MLKILPLFSIILYTQSEASKALPNFVIPCKIDGDLAACYKNNIEKLRPRLIKGIPELQILGLDPLHVLKLTLSRSDSAILSYNMTVTNLTIVGGKDFTIDDLEIDLDDPTFMLKLRIPNTVMKGDFVATGVIVGFPVKNPGKAIAEFSDILITYKSNGKTVAKKGKTYIEWSNDNFQSTYTESKFIIEGVFTDPEQLRLFNRALNENADLLHSHIIPTVKNAFGVYITESLRRVHNLFPLSVLYS